MNPLASVTAGFQVISSWLMSMLAILTILISVVICIAFVEFAFERGAVRRAYTVKCNSTDGELPALRDQKRDKNVM
jgi:hypothetical protein